MPHARTTACHDPSPALIQRLPLQVTQLLAEILSEAHVEPAVVSVPAAPTLRIRDYARWELVGVTPVSRHSAVYHFRTDDGARGTPIRTGRGGRTVWSKTWHTTLLAEVGEEQNTEGPLPWIERDYTPISTAHEWVNGTCDILIKIYLEPPGLATGWLHRISTGRDADGAAFGTAAGSARAVAGTGARVWLSRPMKTLHVPSLASNEQHINRKHVSVLLLVAGTGVVAVPQVLHARSDHDGS